MRPIQVKQLDYDLTPTAGLALVGHHLKTLAPVLPSSTPIVDFERFQRLEVNGINKLAA